MGKLYLPRGVYTLYTIKKFNINTKVSISEVQRLFGAINAYNADGGLIISTGKFTNSSLEFAHRINPPIYLMTFHEFLNKLSNTS